MSAFWARERFGEAPLEVVSCPSCGVGDKDDVLVRPDDLPVVRCRRCGLHYVNPQPTRDALRIFYAANYFQGAADLFSGMSYVVARRIAFEQETVTGWHDLSKFPLRGMRVLEIGCASGELLLLALRAGAEAVKGIELDPEIAEYGRKKNRVEIVCGTAEEQLRREQGMYDVVCAFDVIEHLKDPAAVLREVRRVLTDQGRFLCAVPNGENISIWGRDWSGIRRNMEHLLYPRVADLRKLAEDAGLLLVHAETRGNPLELAKYPRWTEMRQRWVRLFVCPHVAICNVYRKTLTTVYGRQQGHEIFAIFAKQMRCLH